MLVFCNLSVDERLFSDPIRLVQVLCYTFNVFARNLFDVLDVKFVSREECRILLLPDTVTSEHKNLRLYSFFVTLSPF